MCIQYLRSNHPYTYCPYLGGIINRYLISVTVQIYERMGMGKLDVYRTDLEQKLLDDTRSGHHHHPGRAWTNTEQSVCMYVCMCVCWVSVYYARKANDWIAKDSTPDYLVRWQCSDVAINLV